MTEELSGPSDERLNAVLLQLSGAVQSRLRRFLNRQEFVGMRPTDIIGILLDREGIYQKESRAYSPKRRRADSPEAGQVALAHQQKSNFDRVVAVGRNETAPTEGNFEEQIDEDDFLEDGEVMDDELDDDYAAEEIVPSEKVRRKQRSQRGKSSHPERKGIGTGKQKSWTSALRRYLYDIIVKWQRDGLLHCRECDRWMRVVHKSCGLRCVNALDHVCGHLGQPMYACRLCVTQTVTSMQMRKHLKQVHGRTNDFDDLTHASQRELEERITRCFDHSDVGGPPSGSRRLLTCKKKPGEVGVGRSFLSQQADLDSSSVRRFIYDLVTKWQMQNSVFCRQCNHWIRLGVESPWAQTQAALAHICGHYGKHLYRCLICDDQTITYNQMMRHIRHVHQTISRGNCLEKIDSHQAELKNLTALCFDWDGDNGPPELTADGPFLKKPRQKQQSTSKGRKRKQESSCRLQAFAYGRRLIKDVSGRSLKMCCQLCDTWSIVKSAKGVLRPEVLFNHALNHMDSDAYACRFCEKKAKRAENMRMHVAVSHKNADPTDYVDNTGEFQDVIFDMMTKCYDPNSE